MIKQLYECDCCKWSTFSYEDPRRTFGARVDFHGSGMAMEICGDCVGRLLNAPVIYKPFEVPQEVDPSEQSRSDYGQLYQGSH